MEGKKINKANKLLTLVTSQNRKMGKKREKTGLFSTETWHSEWELQRRSKTQSIIGSIFRLWSLSRRKRNRNEDKVILFLVRWTGYMAEP